MPSSISSSSDRLPRNAVSALLISLFICLVVIGIVELRMRQAGITPAVHDTRELWAAERARASSLGEKALILVGDSRMLLDVDLGTLAEATGLEPVQLAIDGSDFLPVLADLAGDPDVSGTVVIGAEVRKLFPGSSRDKASDWVDFYNEKYRGLWAPAVEASLKVLAQSWFSLYSSGIPWERLWPILIGKVEKKLPGYLTTRPNRQKDGDYDLVPQPDFYLERVVRTLGQRLYVAEIVDMDRFAYDVRRVMKWKPPGKPVNPRSFTYANSLIDRIMARGGKVVVVRLPSSGLVWEIDEYRYPRLISWDRFVVSTRARTIHFMDYPGLQYQLPDGSHMDVRDKVKFTDTLADLLLADHSSPRPGPGG